MPEPILNDHPASRAASKDVREHLDHGLIVIAKGIERRTNIPWRMCRTDTLMCPKCTKSLKVCNYRDDENLKRKHERSCKDA